MARQQVDDLPRIPKLVPAAGASLGGARPVAPNVSLGPYLGASRLAGKAAAVAGEHQEKLSEEWLNEARADVAANPNLVEELLGAAPGDEEAQQRIMAQAANAGAIRHSDSPYFQSALLEATARTAANKALLSTQSRIAKGEHLPHQDENGVEQAGKSFEEILDEELRQYRAHPALDSKLGSAAFAGVMQRGQPVIREQALRTLDSHNIAVLEQSVGDELSSLVRAAQGAEEGEVAVLAGRVEKEADRLRVAGIENFREVAAGSIIRGVMLMADQDPDRASLHLNTIVGELVVGGQKLDENPRTAAMLVTARERLRKYTDEQKRHEETDRTRVEDEQGRETENTILKFIREQKDGSDLSNTEIRRKARNHFETWMAGRVGDPEFAENAEKHRVEGLRLIDATLSADKSDPQLVDELTAQLSLAQSVEEVGDVEQIIRGEAGRSLFGAEIEKLIGKVTKKRTAMNGGYASDPTYSRAYGELAQIDVPKGTPLARDVSLSSELRKLDYAWQDEVQAAVEKSGGEIDANVLSEISRRYEASKRELVDAESQRILTAREESYTAILDNTAPEEIRSRYTGRLDVEEIRDLAAQATSRQAFFKSLAHDSLVQRASGLGELESVVVDQIIDLTDDPASATDAVLALRTEFEGKIKEALKGRDVKLEEGQSVAAQVGREFVRERLATIGAERRAGTTEGADPANRELEEFLPQGLEGDAQRRAAIRAPELYDDAIAGATLGSGGDPLTTQNYAPLTRLAGPADEFSGTVSKAQERLYASGLFAHRASHTMAKNSVRWALNRRIRDGGGKNLGELYVAGMAPIGLPIDEVLAGEVTMPLTRADEQGLEITKPRAIKIPVAKIPPYSTPFFQSEGEVRKFVDKRGDEFDRLMRTWGIQTEEAQMVWVKTQVQLAERLSAAISRNGD